MSDNTYKFLTVFLATAALVVALVQTRHMMSGTNAREPPACTLAGSSTPCR